MHLHLCRGRMHLLPFAKIASRRIMHTMIVASRSLVCPPRTTAGSPKKTVLFKVLSYLLPHAMYTPLVHATAMHCDNTLFTVYDDRLNLYPCLGPCATVRPVHHRASPCATVRRRAPMGTDVRTRLRAQ